MYDDMTRILKFRFRFFYDKHMFYFVVLNDSVELMICDEIVGTCVTMLVEPASDSNVFLLHCCAHRLVCS